MPVPARAPGHSWPGIVPDPLGHGLHGPCTLRECSEEALPAYLGSGSQSPHVGGEPSIHTHVASVPT
eukprot:2767203-Prorocentrum_lima.AAC.1